MRICGADFSGAKSPQLALAVGRLEGDHLTIEHVHPCDDRLDLFALIAFSANGPQLCGLDFPFRLPAAALARLGVRELHELAFSLSREAFADQVEQALGRYEGRCAVPSLYCRQTDAVCGAYSGVKRINPSLVQMLYSGSKLLWYLWDDGVMTYPCHAPALCQVCEVYPSHTWRAVGMRRTRDMRAFVDAFNALGLLQVTLPEAYAVVDTQDVADSIVACVTTAAVQARDDIYTDWSKPSFAAEAEWAVARDEGIIVRI